MFTLLISFLLCFNSVPKIYVSASENKTYYAQVMFDETFLYRSDNLSDDCSNIFFELPKTYFVELTDIANNNFYKAKYLTFSGYVKKDRVQAIAGIPSNPFLNNISFRIFSEQSRDMRTQPNTFNGTSNQVTYIPLLTRNITYFGKIYGESLIEGRTNIWYYCKYSADKDYYGYVYSDFCDELSTIPVNTENVTHINNPTFSTEPTNPYTIPESSNKIGIIVGILSIPATIFLIMIVKGKHILSKEKLKDKEIIDY